MSKYMIVLALSLCVPLVLSFRLPLGIWRNFRALFASLALILAIFGTWDMLASRMGHWYFNPDGVCGAYIVNLPLEEWLFFIVIPFCCIFTWEALHYLKAKTK